LLAKADCLTPRYWMCHRLREQARSYNEAKALNSTPSLQENATAGR
jgi:hypothetical protein